MFLKNGVGEKRAKEKQEYVRKRELTVEDRIPQNVKSNEKGLKKQQK